MKIVIIGGVAAGMSAAAKAKRSCPNASIIVIEQGQDIAYGACGLPYYVGGYNNDMELMRIRGVEEFRRSGIDVRLGQEVFSVDPAQKTLTVSSLTETYEESYDKLLIATGAGAVIPAVEGVQAAGVFVLKNLVDGAALKAAVDQEAVKNVVIIGGGYIGIEVAEAMTAKGKNVAVVEAADRILSGFDEEITAIATQELQQHGVQILTGESLKRILTHDGRFCAVETSQRVHSADAVVLALGVRPRTQFLAGSGISLAGNGAVVIDRQMRTNVDDIYAAGDCATVYHELLARQVYIPLGTNANKQGRLAGENICGANREMPGVLGTASVKIMDLEAVKTGLTEQDAERYGLAVKTVFVEAPSHAPYYPNPTPIHIKLVYSKDSGILLGAQLIGRQGVVLRGHVLATCIHARMTLSQIGWLDFSYAPPFAMPWDAVHVAANAAK